MSDSKPEAPLDAQHEAPPSMAQSLLRSAIGLALFALLTAGLIALTQVQTADRIAEEVRKARSKALYEIAPAETHNNDILSESFGVLSQDLGLVEVRPAFVAKQDGQPVTLVLPVRAPDGYTGPIRLIVGIDVATHRISGVRVTQHKETPGLGDKIEIKKSDWVRSFEQRSLSNTDRDAWQVKKDGGDFDQLTGATITPRAIVGAVHRALQFYHAHREHLLQQTPGSIYRADDAALEGES